MTCRPHISRLLPFAQITQPRPGPSHPHDRLMARTSLDTSSTGGRVEVPLFCLARRRALRLDVSSSPRVLVLRFWPPALRKRGTLGLSIARRRASSVGRPMVSAPGVPVPHCLFFLALALVSFLPCGTAPWSSRSSVSFALAYQQRAGALPIIQ